MSEIEVPRRAFYEFILKLVRIFRPGQSKWIVRIFIASGITLVSHHFWEPLLEAWLKKEFEVSIAAADVPGWVLISIGLFLYFYNRRFEKDEKRTIVSSPEVPLQRPQRAEHFTGREEKLRKVLIDLQPGKIITLCGPGGIGKSALAAEAVWKLAQGNKPPKKFPDGIIYHDFYVSPKAEQALEHVALSFNEKPEPTPIEAARRVLSGRKVLIVLDGAENADDLPRVLSVVGSCGVLVTSQKHSDAAAEWLDIDPLPEPEGIRLLQAWCLPVVIDDEIGRPICELLGFLPLAVRLAGRYMHQTGERPADYLDWLKDSPLDALDHGERRLESVTVLIKRCIAKLNESSLNALYVTGLLALAPFRSEVVASALDIQPAAARQLLGELVCYGLLVKQNDHQDFAVSHRLIYTYANHKSLTMPGAAGRLADYYGDFSRTQGKKGQEGYARLNDHRAHIMQVLAVCDQQHLWQPLTNLVMAVENYLDLQGYRSDQITALEKGLKASKKLKDTRAEGDHLSNLGVAYRSLGQYEIAIEYHNQALAISRKIGDGQGVGAHLGNLGIAYRSLGQYEKAVEYYNQALAIARKIGDGQGVGAHLGNLGNAYFCLGQFDKAIEHYNQALAIAREIGDRLNEGSWLGSLGNAYFSFDHYNKAIEHYNQAIDIAREIGDRIGDGRVLGNLGNAYFCLGQLDKAIEHYNQALAIAREIGDRLGEGNNLGNLGVAYKFLGQFDKAVEYLNQVLEIAREIGDRKGEGTWLGNLGSTYYSLAQHDKAVEYLNQALEIAREIGDRKGEGTWLGDLGNANLSLGQFDKAAEYLNQALAIAREIGDRLNEGNDLSDLGTAYRSLDQYDKAVEHYSQALVIFEEIKSPTEEKVRKRLAELQGGRK